MTVGIRFILMVPRPRPQIIMVMQCREYIVIDGYSS